VFRAIVSDPPWTFGDALPRSEDKPKRGASRQYEVMNVESLSSLRVDRVALDDSLLFLWVPASMIADGLKVMTGWGFER